jgi:hypothetical protein
MRMIKRLYFYQIFSLYIKKHRLEIYHNRRIDRNLDSFSSTKRKVRYWWEKDKDVGAIEEQILTLMSHHLCDKAEKYNLPYPGINYDQDVKFIPDANWMLGHRTQFPMLTPEAFSLIRSSIRKERKERCEQIFMWFAGLATLIAVLTGILSFFK